MLPKTLLPAFFVIALVSARGSDKVPTFSQLSAGESLQMRFTSAGCFHMYTYDLTFEMTDGAKVTVASVERKWNPADKVHQDGARTELGQLSLSSADLAGLDKLLAYYRSVQTGGCTTHDKITISHIRGGKVLAREEFNDGTCAADRASGVLTVHALTGRLAPPPGR